MKSEPRTTNHEPRITNHGFMLIEVLVTCGVLTFGLIYTSKAFMNCLQAMAQVENYTTAFSLAEEKLWEWETGNKKTSLTGESGTFSKHPGFDYALETTAVEGYASSLKETNLKISWKEGRRKGNFEINSYLFTEDESN